MFDISIQVIEQKLLDMPLFEKAVKRASSRAMESARAELVRATTEKYYVKASSVRESLMLRKSQGVIVSRGKRLNLAKFRVTPMSSKQGRRTGYMAAVRRDTGMKKLGSRIFIMDKRKALFHRMTKFRMPIEAVTAPAVPQLLRNREIQARIKTRAHEVFEARLEHELSRL